MTVKFKEISVGGRFEFRGRRYRKVALSMAHDEDRCGNIFRDETDVVPGPEALVPAGPAAALTTVCRSRAR